jgi:PAS domain S-box-containing protein
LRMKTAEDTLRRQKDVLEEMVQSRTAELTHSIIQMEHEIDQRKKTEEALMKSENRFKTIFEQYPIGIALIDSLTGDIYEVNPKFAKIAGRTLEEMSNIDWMSITHPDDVQENLDNMALLNAGEITGFNMNKRCVRPDGSHVWINMTIAPIIVRDKSHPRHLCMIEDITTDRKTAREKEKLEAQLQQAQKMESIGTLAGGIAHDFNNILFPIVGHTEMLLEDISNDSPFRESLDEIYTGSLRARDLVKQILTFSRQDNSELKLMKMQPIIKEALKLIRSTIPTTIEIKQDIHPDCGVIKADPTQIHQITMNLTTNSYHAMEETGGELKVSLKEIELDEYDVLRPDMKPGIYACLTIADTGIGMDKELIRTIFDPFFTTKKKGKGTGMGLSVVHGIVENMNGVIQVYSEPGEGTQFHVYLPVEKTSFDKPSIPSHETIPGGTEHILLVDDEEAILKMEKRMLERLGYQVTSRTSSIEALEAFSANPDKFDLVITDMAMPNMPGDKLAVELTKIRPDIPVLLCTGFSETMSEEKAISIGIKGFLLKPIVMKDLAQKIREVLGKK